MSSEHLTRYVYQFHVCLCQRSPLIWRRLLMRSDSSIADIRQTPQIAICVCDGTRTSSGYRPSSSGTCR
jgi:hypothetical protein